MIPSTKVEIRSAKTSYLRVQCVILLVTTSLQLPLAAEAEIPVADDPLADLTTLHQKVFDALSKSQNALALQYSQKLLDSLERNNLARLPEGLVSCMIYFNHGLALGRNGHREPAIKAFEKAYQASKNDADILGDRLPFFLSELLKMQGHWEMSMYETSGDQDWRDKGMQSHLLSVGVRPADESAWSALTQALAGIGLEGSTLRSVNTTWRLGPSSASWARLGLGLARFGETERAVVALRRAVKNGHDDHKTRVELAHNCRIVADWSHYYEDLDRIVRDAEADLREGFNPYFQPWDALGVPVSNSLRLRIARSYAKTLSSKEQPFGNWNICQDLPMSTKNLGEASFAKPLIAFMSSDFVHRSAVGRALLPGMIATSKYARIVIIPLENPKAETKSFVKTVRNKGAVAEVLHGLNNEEAARRLNRLGVALLMNVNGYTGTPRMEIYSLKPAPVQALLQAHAGTTGADYIDYNIVDSVQVPPEYPEFYSEKLALLPVTAFLGEFSRPHISDEMLLEARRRLNMSRDESVYGNFNRAFKLHPGALEIWKRILHNDSSGSLLMYQWKDQTTAPAFIRRSLGKYGHRLKHCQLPPLSQRMTAKAVADVFLDTPVYNAHGTATEVLAAGVSVVTLPTDDCHAGRVAASVLIAANKSEGIARNSADYVEIAVKLAKKKRAQCQSANCGATEQFDKLKSSGFMSADSWAKMIVKFAKSALDTFCSQKNWPKNDLADTASRFHISISSSA